MKKCFLLCMLLFSLPCWAESALNLSQYKTIQDLYFNEQAATEIIQRMEVALVTDQDLKKPYNYLMTNAADKGIINRMKNGLYFGKRCLQGNCDMLLQEKGRQTIIIMDRQHESFSVFFKDPLSHKEINKILLEVKNIVVKNPKISKNFTVKLRFFNQ